MKQTCFVALLAFSTCFFACKNDSKKAEESAEKAVEKTIEKTPIAAADSSKPAAEKPAETPSVEPASPKNDAAPTPVPAKKPQQKDQNSGVQPTKKHGLNASKWADVCALDASILIDIRYATANNFTKSKIYDCPACFLRPEAGAALVLAQKALKKQGFGLKMFDCYRPRPYQQRLWDKVPNPDYVTPPAKGSMHSRGAAVDLTLVDAAGKELDMGTEYDFFGREAHTDFLNFSPKILENRKRLNDALEAVGFAGIRTEWWHFSFKKGKYDLASEVWNCEK